MTVPSASETDFLDNFMRREGPKLELPAFNRGTKRDFWVADQDCRSPEKGVS
jgi:hypothetical protein